MKEFSPLPESQRTMTHFYLLVSNNQHGKLLHLLHVFYRRHFHDLGLWWHVERRVDQVIHVIYSIFLRERLGTAYMISGA